MYANHKISELRTELLKLGLDTKGGKEELIKRLEGDNDAKIIVIDLETNGFPKRKGFDKYYSPEELDKYDTSRIVEIAYIIYSEDGEIIKEVDHLVKPNNFRIPNSNFHGITYEMANTDGKNMSEILDELERDLNGIEIIVSHNINFDYNILLSECHRINKISAAELLIALNKQCTMKIGQNYMKMQKSPKLTELYAYLFRKRLVQSHRALPDAKSCGECYFKMLAHFA